MDSTTSATDPLWLDRMYNNRALVADHAAYFSRWSGSSALARQQLVGELDLPYGSGPFETSDVFLAAPRTQVRGGAALSTAAPVMVFVHGGYWRSLDKSDHTFIAPAFTQAGACVVVPNYSLCPAVTIPEIVLQMARALAWTWRNVAAYGGDPARITVVGHSAGGHLAAMLLACDWRAHGDDLPRALIKNALSISGLYDLEPLRHTPFLSDLNLTEEHALQASPCLTPSPAQGCLYSVAGGDESDEFLRQNRLIRQAWSAGVVPVCEALPGLNHFSVLEALVEPRHRLNLLALDLLGLGAGQPS